MRDHSDIVELQCHGPRKLLLWQMFLFISIFVKQDEAAAIPIPKSYTITFMEAGMDFKNPQFIAPEGMARIYRKSRGSPVVLNVFFPFISDLPTSVNTSYLVYRKLSNQWKESFINIHKVLCKSIESTTKADRFLYEYSDFPNKCPIVKGNYSIDNFNLDNAELPAVIPLSEYKLRVNWHIGDMSILKWWLIAKVEKASII